MSIGRDDLNDDLSDLLGPDAAKYRRTEPVQLAASYKPIDPTEPCNKCRGTGQFRSYSGRAVGPCFTCKGSGKLTRRQVGAQKAKVTAVANKIKKAEAFRAENPDVVAWIARNPGFEFAQKMDAAIADWGSLTDGQLAAVQKCIVKDAERQAKRAQERVEREASAPVVDISKIERAFAKARETAQRKGALGIWLKPLRLRAGTKEAGLDLLFSAGSAGSQWEGQIFVKTGDRKLGAVKGGKFVRRFECTDAEETMVLQVCSDPLQAAIAYGKAWSVCSVCGQTLTNDVSIERGIGPICAEKYGW